MAVSAQQPIEPQPSASIQTWRSWIGELISAGLFTARFFSWVCVREKYFLKIPRVSGGQPETDFIDGAGEAEREYRLTQGLAERFDGMVDAPLRLVDGCIVKRRLTGPDLWVLAKEKWATPPVHKGLSHAALFAAELHRLDPTAMPGLAVHDYANDPYLPAPEELQDRLQQRRRTIVLRGFEVRNFRQDRPGGQWKFFDPHEAVLGMPEDDFARYILSLLMINWGRHGNCRIWTRFDYRQILRVYETTRGASLDQELLVYMFRRNIAERRHRARRATCALSPFMWRLARAYEKLYFWQISRWGAGYGL